MKRTSTAIPRNRQQSRAVTRERLVSIAREHFIRDGLGGAILEKIAAEAGFTRGALYANFSNKEELFVAVVRSTIDAELQNFQTILASDRPAKERFELMRDAVGSLVTNPAWVFLQVEFQANALRSPDIREAFVAQLEHRRKEGAALLVQFAEELGLSLAGTPDEVAGVLGALIEGLAVRQAILQPPDAERAKKLAILCFDRLVSTPSSSQ